MGYNCVHPACNKLPCVTHDGTGAEHLWSMPYSISVESSASQAFLNDILKESLWEWTMKWAGTYCGPTLVPDLRWASWMNIVLEVGHLKNYSNFPSKQHHFLHTCSIQHTRRLPITRESYSSAFKVSNCFGWLWMRFSIYSVWRASDVTSRVFVFPLFFFTDIVDLLARFVLSLMIGNHLVCCLL